MSREAVLDFEGFYLHPHTFVIKELAYYDINLGYHGRWLFKPPCSFSRLTLKKKIVYGWLTRNTHKIKWEDGDHSYESIRKILSFLFMTYSRIYVKGIEKVKLLPQNSSCTVINLDTISCPRMQDLNPPKVYCPRHSENTVHCAMNKAAAYASFL